MVAYDTLIVGGGLAGLYTMRELLKKNPTERILLCEKYKKLGGRAVTYTKEDLQWEIGAGRISSSHTMVHKLIREYGLHATPIGAGLVYRETGVAEYEENHFEPAIEVVLGSLRALSPEILATHTLKELLVKVHGQEETKKWMNRFPYHSEMVVMRADMALREFFSEMKSHAGYTYCKEGLSELTRRMADDCVKRGGVILPQNELIECGEGWANFRMGSWKDGATRPIRKIEAGRIILALHHGALKKLALFRGWPLLKHVEMPPLFRIYAVFDTPWFEGLTRVVTTNPIRYFLPISITPERSVAMVSYTDDVFAKHYMKILDEDGERGLQTEVLRDLRALFPERKIPVPTFFKPHPWDYGVSYWTPGEYSPEEESAAALEPFPGKKIYVCGESFSLRQGWMEGALEHAAALLSRL